MNIFGNCEGFLGGSDTGPAEDSTLVFWKLAKELRSRLGDKAELLDRYLSGLLEGIGGTLAYEAADEGFLRGGGLRQLCAGILRGDSSGQERAHPLYQTVSEYIDEHPLPDWGFHTSLSVYHAALADVFLRHAAAEYFAERQRALDAGVADLRALYWEICVLLGETEPVERLNEAVRTRFLQAAALPVFLQGMNNDLLDSLLHRDGGSGGPVFRLMLDHEDIDIC